jgi:hypothetical protein
MISWLVNGGSNQLDVRQQVTKYISNILLDESPQTGATALSYPPLTSQGGLALTQTFPPTEVAFTASIMVHYDQQKP